jgi:hypothetical protein
MDTNDYIKREHKLDDSVEIEFVGFEGSPSRGWSDWTSESFSCELKYRIIGKYYPSTGRQYDYVFLGEDEVIEFLGGMTLGSIDD